MKQFFLEGESRTLILLTSWKLQPWLLKELLKRPEKVKRIRNYILKSNLYLYFLIRQKLLISYEKMVMSPELKVFVK